MLTLPIVIVFSTADYDEYVCKLPHSTRAYLNKVLDWDNKGVDKDLEKISQLMTDDVEIKLFPELAIPDEDKRRIIADFPNKKLLQWYELLKEFYCKLFDTGVYLLYRQAVLRKWKKLNGIDATYGKLLRLCCEKDILSLAEAICDMLRSRVDGEFLRRGLVKTCGTLEFITFCMHTVQVFLFSRTTNHTQ